MQDLLWILLDAGWFRYIERLPQAMCVTHVTCKRYTSDTRAAPISRMRVVTIYVIEMIICSFCDTHWDIHRGELHLVELQSKRGARLLFQ